VEYGAGISASESVLGEIREPQRFPEIFLLRRELLSWRFYHQFRTDAESPIRQPQVGTRTPVLSHDGRDLAAAIGTILEVGEGEMFRELLKEAFPGAQIEVDVPPQSARFTVRMLFPGFARWFEAGELSDGTIQYLCLLAALLSPRPPELIALNEPEASIHPDLLRALGRLIVKASARTQLWITTHSMQLAEMVRGEAGCHLVQLEKVDGETRVLGQSELERAMEV
jgi:predicted ATPase